MLLTAYFAIALQAQEQATIRTTANEVVVDVVVRDKKGKLIKGLTAADFVIQEDGAKQTITSLRESGGTLSLEDSSKVGTAARTPSDPTRPVRLFSLVFDRLGIDSRRLARQAAYDFIKEELAPDVYVGVFYTDQRLNVVQSYTKDRVKLRAAIDRVVGSNAMTDYANANASLQSAKDGTSGSTGAAAAAAGSGGANVDGAGMAAESMNRMLTDMLEFAETSGREQQGRFSIFGLWAIVKEQSRLPGRKTVMFFSEGLQLPNAVMHQFQSMISAANRANVSVYTIDARGLSTSGDNALGSDMMNRSLRVSQGAYRGSSGAAVTREDAMQFDRALDAIRANPQVALQELAEATGGFLIANMNDFRKPLQRVVEEMGSYYEIIYRPSNMNLDGGFRVITVKVPGVSDAKIQARNGYFALPSLNGKPVAPFEVPLLNALQKKPAPREVDYRAAVTPFRPGQAVIVFDMPMKDLAFTLNAEKTAYRSHFSFLALIKDEQGQVVDKISRDLPVDEPAAKLEGFKQGRAIFTKPVNLPAGRYTLESAASDNEGGKIAARRVAVVVPPREGPLALSGITLIRRVDKAPPQPDAGDPFIVMQNRVIPTLNDKILNKALSLYFVVYPNPGSSEKPAALLEFFKDEMKLGEGAVELPAPLDDGRIPYIANIPADKFQPGLYEIRVTARQGSAMESQSIFVTME
jgi:VWFA-related protein